MKVWLFFVVAVSLLFVLGCTEEQMQQVDKVAVDVNLATQLGQVVLNAPAGMLIPPEIRWVFELIGGVAIGVVGAWAKYRERQRLKEVVLGIENFKAKTKTDTTSLGVSLNSVESAGTKKVISAIKISSGL